MGFIRFWMNLNIFTMVKLVNPLMNEDQLLQIGELAIHLLIN
jgi:hypothetical protein